MRLWKSDSLIVLRVWESHAHGEAASGNKALSRDTCATHRGSISMSTQLARIADKARRDPRLRFSSLAHVMTEEFLTETWTKLNRQGAAGVDRETMDEFTSNLAERIHSLH